MFSTVAPRLNELRRRDAHSMFAEELVLRKTNN